MKRSQCLLFAKPWCLLMLGLGLLIFAGCSRKYVITLNNGAQLATASKPRLDRGQYHYTDPRGKKVSIPAGRVLEIAPASMTQDQNARFKPASN